jgi:hypothetical protein
MEIIAEMSAFAKETTAFQGAMEAFLESKEPTSLNIESIVVHEEVPEERGRSENCQSTEEAILGLASSRMAPTAEETDPG